MLAFCYAGVMSMEAQAKSAILLEGHTNNSVIKSQTEVASCHGAWKVFEFIDSKKCAWPLVSYVTGQERSLESAISFLFFVFFEKREASTALKEVLVDPLLNRTVLVPMVMDNCCPIYNHPLLEKVVEKESTFRSITNHKMLWRMQIT